MHSKFLSRANSPLFISMKKVIAKCKASYFILLSILFSAVANGQAANEKVQMAEGMRSSGKIYVVVAVLLTVLAGLILYLVRLDKKISRLENKTDHS